VPLTPEQRADPVAGARTPEQLQALTLLCYRAFMTLPPETVLGGDSDADDTTAELDRAA
jgi:hypothetical protein